MEPHTPSSGMSGLGYHSGDGLAWMWAYYHRSRRVIRFYLIEISRVQFLSA